MGKVFNKGLSEEDKKEGILKRLKNIEDKNENYLMKSKSYKKMLITENYKLEVVTMLIMILVTTKHLKNYVEIFITNKLQ